MFIRKRRKRKANLAAPSRDQMVRHKHESYPHIHLLFRVPFGACLCLAACSLLSFFPFFLFKTYFFIQITKE